MADHSQDVTQLLKAWQAGQPAAADRLIAATYDELRRLARGYLRNERPDHTLQATALVHEAYLRLFGDQPVDVASRGAFFGLLASQMKRQLIDHARRRGASKRGGALVEADFAKVADVLPAAEQTSNEALLERLDRAVARLAHEHPRAAQVVQRRFFGGLTNEDVARELGLSVGTVKREFAFARAWLAREVRDD